MDGQTDADKPVVPPVDAAKPAEAAPGRDAKAASHRKFFMDVRKPKAGAKAAPSAAPAPTEMPSAEPQPASQAAAKTEPSENLPDDMTDIAPAPPEEVAEITDDPAKKLEEPSKKDKQPKVKVTKPPKPPRRPGVGLAIFATLIIVLGLAALATYAYLRTNNISVF